jgi:hypothetical protein
VSLFEITTIEKAGGPLTKRIELAADGSTKSDASQCVMAHGTARRFRFAHFREFATLLERLRSNEAITTGQLRAELPEKVEVTTKSKLNGAARPDLISRTQDFINYRAGEPALALIDYDTKGMPPSVAAKIEELGGGLWPALLSVVPALDDAGRVMRRSTSAGLYRSDTGEELAGSDGLHIFLAVADGAEIERFLKTLHVRCWLAGLGWLMTGAGGQLLERSVVDRVVGTPERLVFEGAPVLVPPLAQSAAGRMPNAIEGGLLDTVAACPPISILERAQFRDLLAKQRDLLAPAAAKAKAEFVAVQADKLVAGGMARSLAELTIERQCAGILLPGLVLPFDDEDFAGHTVADVLADPARYEGATMADPLEGVEYGSGKAKIMRRIDGSPWIHSFAHGRTVYELKLDFDAARAALNKATADNAVDVFVRVVLAGDLGDDQIEQLRDIASQIAHVGKRPIMARLKRAQKERDSARAKQERDRRVTDRRDPRPQVPAPESDAEWLPQMRLLNDVLGSVHSAEPPMRDLEGYVIQVRARRVAGLHLLTAVGANEGDADETRLPAPEQLLLSRLDETVLAELIERHIEYVIEGADAVRPVHLNAAFVKHYQVRSDDVLPTGVTVANLPIVLPDGSLAAGPGLDRRLGVVFRVTPRLRELLPAPKDCTRFAVADAMRFLTHEWLCDVATDYQGRCILIACALTIIERALLPERPGFFITAGQRGGGKTTALHMLSTGVLGHRAAAAAWSPNDEERRKALFSYLAEGIPLLCWDNLPRGAVISCASIEKALTADIYSDRILGVSENRRVPAFTVQAFTGNNIVPRGDMASRVLDARLSSDRPDPENRKFEHPDPVGWTEANRGRILKALYTLLLGNPRRRELRPSPAPSRFKQWWNLVGSSVEYAAQQHIENDADRVRAFLADPEPHPTCPPAPICFEKTFLVGEAEDVQTVSLAAVLEVLRIRFGRTFSASEVSTYAAQAEPGAIAFRDAIEHATGKPLKIISSTTIAGRRKSLKDAPVWVGEQVMALRYQEHHQGGMFSVETLKA